MHNGMTSPKIVLGFFALVHLVDYIRELKPKSYAVQRDNFKI